MDWGKYADYSELFKYMEKCTDLIDGYDKIKKKRPFAQKLDYEASSLAYKEKSFGQAFLNLLEGPEHLDRKMKNIKVSGIFKDAIAIISKMSQDDYKAALQNLDDISKNPKNKPKYYKEISFNDLAKSVERENRTSLQEFPATIEQFKTDAISLFISQGIELDTVNLAKEKSVTESLKSLWSTTKEGLSTAWKLHAIVMNVVADNLSARFKR